MPNTLIVSAGNWEPKRVGCTFTVKANGVPLKPRDMNARRTSAEVFKVDEKAVLAAQYGSWPPTTWEIPSLSTATYVDRQNLVSAGGLNFPTQTSQVVPNDDTAVLELRQARSPRLFGVTWPRAIAPAPGVVPSILMFLRQTSGQNLVNGVFTPRTTDPFT